MTGSNALMPHSQESDGEIELIKIANLVSLIVEYDNLLKTIPIEDGPLADALRMQARQKRKEVEEAGVIGLRHYRDTSLEDSVYNLGAKEYTSTLFGAGIIRIYGITNSNITCLPSTEGGLFDRFLSSMAREGDEDMIVAVPAVDYHDGYILYNVFPGGFIQLTDGEPVTLTSKTDYSGYLLET